MLTKLLLILVLLAIVISLGTALFSLISDSAESRRTVRALTWRSLLSIALFLFLLLAFAFGLVRPHAPGFIHAMAKSTAHHQ